MTVTGAWVIKILNIVKLLLDNKVHINAPFLYIIITIMLIFYNNYRVFTILCLTLVIGKMALFGFLPKQFFNQNIIYNGEYNV